MRWDLGDNGGEVVFKSFQDALEWAKKESQSWQNTLKEIGQFVGNLKLSQALNVRLGELINPMLELAHLDGSQSIKELRAGIDSTMKLFDDRLLLSQDNPRRQALMNLIPDAPFIALGEVTAMLGLDPYKYMGSIHQEGQAHFLAGFTFLQPPDTNAIDEVKKLKKSLETSTNELNKARETVDRVVKSTGDLDTKIEKSIKHQDAVIADYQEQLVQLRSSYVGERQLEEPSHHWDTQAGLYKGRFEAAVGYLLFMIVGVGLFVGFGADDLLKALTKATGNTFQYSHVVILIILAGAIFWLMNVISKQINHTRIRKADAEFRKTASDTFIALLKDERRPIKDDDKHIILDALFRPPAEDHSGTGESVTPAMFLANILRELRSK